MYPNQLSMAASPYPAHHAQGGPIIYGGHPPVPYQMQPAHSHFMYPDLSPTLIGYSTPPGGIGMSQLPQQQVYGQPMVPCRNNNRNGNLPSYQLMAPGNLAAGGITQEPTYEVQNSQLKAPVPNTSSGRLLSQPPHPTVYGSCHLMRICEMFPEDGGAAADTRHEMYVSTDYLGDTRKHLSSWLLSQEEEFNEAMVSNPQLTFRIFVADLKEVVEVPVTALVFTKGLYVDPTTRARRTRGLHASSHSGATAAQVPTSCGLYAVDPSHCKWGRWCNQVHIDMNWMNTKKVEFDQWFQDLETRYYDLAPDHLFTVHDPQLKNSIRIPKFAMSGFTRGLFQGSTKKASSVCLLFQRGRCTAGPCCNQIHVNTDYLSLARMQAGVDVSTTEEGDVADQIASMRSTLVRQQEEETQKHRSQLQQRQQQSSADSDPPAGDLIEHIQVDDAVEESAEIRQMDGSTTAEQNFNGSAGLVTVRRSSGWSYTNNPYCSVRSWTETHSGLMDSARLNSGIAIGGVAAKREGPPSFARTPAASLTHMGSKSKSIRVVALVNSPQEEYTPVRSDHGDSTTSHGGDITMLPTFVPSSNVQPHGSRTTMAQTPSQFTSANNNSLFPSYLVDRMGISAVDFDTSLHFSLSPLLSCSASHTSVPRGVAMRGPADSLNVILEEPPAHATSHLGDKYSNSNNSPASHPNYARCDHGRGQSLKADAPPPICQTGGSPTTPSLPSPNNRMEGSFYCNTPSSRNTFVDNSLNVTDHRASAHS